MSTNLQELLDSNKQWAANTELSTRFLERGDEAQGDAGALSQTIGKAVGDNAWELFVSCAPADALSLELARPKGSRIASSTMRTASQ